MLDYDEVLEKRFEGPGKSCFFVSKRVGNHAINFYIDCHTSCEKLSHWCHQ